MREGLPLVASHTSPSGDGPLDPGTSPNWESNPVLECVRPFVLPDDAQVMEPHSQGKKLDFFENEKLLTFSRNAFFY